MAVGRTSARGARIGLLALLVSFLLGASATAAVMAPMDGLEEEASSGGEGTAMAVECDLDRYRCGIAENVLRSFPYPWATLGYTVTVTEPPDDWMRGRTLLDERRIELFIRDETTADELAATFAHEVGHAVHQYCDDEVLEIWRQRRGLPDHVPDYVTPPHDYDSVAEDFAESFRQYLGFGSSLSEVGPAVEGEWLQLNADVFLPICERS